MCEARYTVPEYEEIFEEVYTEETLHKVYSALYRAGLDRHTVAKAVNHMQSAGILFREIKEENSGAGGNI